MTALFGNSGGRHQSKNVVEFRAGKMAMRGNMVHPIKRKGQVYVHQSDDSLMHFCWKDRLSGNVEEDLIIFPDDAEFKHVVQCTTGRVYVLRFKSSQRKLFFWMQEPKTDRDLEYCQKVNESLNNPPVSSSSHGSALASDLSSIGGLAGSTGEGQESQMVERMLNIIDADSDLQSMLGGMSQGRLMQLLGGMGSSAAGLSSLINRPGSAQSSVSDFPVENSSLNADQLSTESTPTPQPTTTASDIDPGSAAPAGMPSSVPSSSSCHPIQLSDLQNILSAMNVPKTEPKEAIDLAKALSPEDMLPILANEKVQAKLIPFLPEGHKELLPKSEQELRDTVASPQFQQALTSFSQALQSGQLGSLMAQFNLGKDVVNAATAGDMEAFVKAMQEAARKKAEGGDDSDGEGSRMEH